MPAMDSLSQILCISTSQYSKHEKIILEAELFAITCDELTQHFTNGFQFIKSNFDKENSTMELNLTMCIINDILLTEEYNLEGIAYHTQIPEEVILDILSGKNMTPSAWVLRKMIDLHRSVKQDLYKEITQKLVAKENAEIN